MKTLNCICTLILVLLFQQCGDDSPDILTLDRQFEIKQEEIITLDLESDTGYIEVQVISIVESRCPANASCVRFGEAEVKVSVTGTQEIATLVDLCIGDCPQLNNGFQETDTVEVTLDDKDYAVILLDVVPYPTTFNHAVPKEALLKIISL